MMMLQPTSGRQGFGLVKEKDQSSNPNSTVTQPTDKVNEGQQTTNIQQQTTDAIEKFHPNDNMSNPSKSPMMLKMLHGSSGRNNFDLVKPDKTNENASSPESTVKDTEALIEQQTRHAIQAASETHQENHDNDQKKST